MYGGWFSRVVRTFFRDKFSDPAAVADLMVFEGHELAEFHRNRGVTKSKDKASGGLYRHGKHSERLRRLRGPAGPGPSIANLVSIYQEKL